MNPVVPVVLTTEERNSLYAAIAGRPAQQPYPPQEPSVATQMTLDHLQRRLGIHTRKALITRAVVQRWI